MTSGVDASTNAMLREYGMSPAGSLTFAARVSFGPASDATCTFSGPEPVGDGAKPMTAPGPGPSAAWSEAIVPMFTGSVQLSPPSVDDHVHVFSLQQRPTTTVTRFSSGTKKTLGAWNDSRSSGLKVSVFWHAVAPRGRRQ